MVLASTAHGAVRQVADAVGVSRPMVWRWQQRFAEMGVEGLLRDKTRMPGTPPVPADVVARVVTLTCGPPPAATHWTGRAMAKMTGISLHSVIVMAIAPVAPAGALRSAWLRAPASSPTDPSRPSDHVKTSADRRGRRQY